MCLTTLKRTFSICLFLRLTLSCFGKLGPHLLDTFEDHVAVSVKCLNSSQQLFVIPAVDEDLGVLLDAVGEDTEGGFLKEK